MLVLKSFVIRRIVLWFGHLCCRVNAHLFCADNTAIEKNTKQQKQKVKKTMKHEMLHWVHKEN